jgi:RNA polymerase sigma-70 factor (ECF subfamily)
MTSQLASKGQAVGESDEALLEQLRRGDADAFERLFLRHYPAVYRVVFHLFGSREEAEDTAQETFLALLHQPPRSGGQLAGWLCRVALNRGYNALRSQRRAEARAAQLGAAPEQADTPDPASELLRAEDRATVRAALADLPERQGQLLLLRYAGLSYAEVAAAAEVAPGSVGTLLARAEAAFLAAYRRRFGREPHDGQNL